jgi:hypothetical protein
MQLEGQFLDKFFIQKNKLPFSQLQQFSLPLSFPSTHLDFALSSKPFAPSFIHWANDSLDEILHKWWKESHI